GLRSPDSAGRGTEREVVIRLDGAALQGHLDIPAGAEGIVLFAHGSGSSRHSPRNQAMAGAFHTAGLATLLFDLLTPEESDDRRNVFDIELLADRLLAATEWVRAQPDSTALARGYFGASTGGGAALWAAGTPGNDVRAVVSRGGRPDLAGPRLADVRCPTLLIGGGAGDDPPLRGAGGHGERRQAGHRVVRAAPRRGAARGGSRWLPAGRGLDGSGNRGDVGGQRRRQGLGALVREVLPHAGQRGQGGPPVRDDGGVGVRLELGPLGDALGGRPRTSHGQRNGTGGPVDGSAGDRIGGVLRAYRSDQSGRTQVAVAQALEQVGRNGRNIEVEDGGGRHARQHRHD